MSNQELIKIIRGHINNMYEDERAIHKILVSGNSSMTDYQEGKFHKTLEILNFLDSFSQSLKRKEDKE